MKIENKIGAFWHCGKCVDEQRASGERKPQDIEVGYTPRGFQVWCRRHDTNVRHIDFRGQKVGIVASRITPKDMEAAGQEAPADDGLFDVSELVDVKIEEPWDPGELSDYLVIRFRQLLHVRLGDDAFVDVDVDGDVVGLKNNARTRSLVSIELVAHARMAGYLAGVFDEMSPDAGGMVVARHFLDVGLEDEQDLGAKYRDPQNEEGTH